MGEKLFSFILLFIGALALILSVDLWFGNPRIAAVPVFVAALWVLMSLWSVVQNFKLTAPLPKAIPLNVIIMIALIAVYSAALLVGVRFYIVTPAFLYISMCCLTRKDFLKNILRTLIVMAFLVLVFRILFSVVFP
ncbi:MAG: hypothetical protein IJR98_04200 [Synergistaceae bacterium]|nr:hypothetical protein [Synergistaceae bacterium]